MGNQDKRLLNLNWLAGFIDAEGSILVETNKHKHTYSPKIDIANSDQEMITRCIEILEEEKIPHYIRSYKDHKNPKRKIVFHIIIAGIKRVRPILITIIPFLVGKRYQAQHILSLCNYRLSRPQNSQYTEVEYDLLRKISLKEKIDWVDERSLDEKLCWLAGLIDGDGCFGTSLIAKKYPDPHLTIVSINQEIINKAEEIIKQINPKIIVKIYETKFTNGWSLRYDIRVRGKNNISLLVPSIINLLTSEKQEAARRVYENSIGNEYMPKAN